MLRFNELAEDVNVLKTQAVTGAYAAIETNSLISISEEVQWRNIFSKLLISGD